MSKRWSFPDFISHDQIIWFGKWISMSYIIFTRIYLYMYIYIKFIRININPIDNNALSGAYPLIYILSKLKGIREKFGEFNGRCRFAVQREEGG